MSLKLDDRESGAKGPELRWQKNVIYSRISPEYEVGFGGHLVLDPGELLAALAKIELGTNQMSRARLTHYLCPRCPSEMFRCHQLFEEQTIGIVWLPTQPLCHLIIDSEHFTDDQVACMIHWLLWNVPLFRAGDCLREKVAPIEGKLRKLAAALAAKPLPAVF